MPSRGSVSVPSRSKRIAFRASSREGRHVEAGGEVARIRARGIGQAADERRAKAPGERGHVLVDGPHRGIDGVRDPARQPQPGALDRTPP